MAKLVGTWGGDKTRAIEIPIGRITVGRKTDNNILLDHKSVSAVHCIVLLEEGRCVVRDLLSTNGTRINGEKITEQQLVHGDMLKIGAIEFMYDGRKSVAAPMRADSSSTIQISLDGLDAPAAIPAETHDGHTEIRPPTAPRVRQAPVAMPVNVQPVMVPKAPTLHKAAMRPPTIVTKRSSKPGPHADEQPPVETPVPEAAENESAEPTEAASTTHGRKGRPKVRIKARHTKAAAAKAPSPDPGREPDEELEPADGQYVEPIEDQVTIPEPEPELETEPASEPEPVEEAPVKKKVRLGLKAKATPGTIRITSKDKRASEPEPAPTPTDSGVESAASESVAPPDPEPAAEAPAKKRSRFSFRKKTKPGAVRIPSPAKEESKPDPASAPEAAAPTAEDKPAPEVAAPTSSADETIVDSPVAEEAAPAAEEKSGATPPAASAGKRRQPNLTKLRAGNKKKGSKGAPIMPKGSLKKKLAERAAAKKRAASDSDS